MEPWISKSNHMKQIAASAGSTVVGAILAYGFRDYGQGRNALAGFLLGILLLGLGLAGLVFATRQTIIVDPRARLISIEDTGLVIHKKRAIHFAQIARVQVGFLGKKSNFMETWYLVLELRDGGTYSLFAPGRFYEGASERTTVEAWRRRLEGYLAAASGTNRS
jgi:hypothetical protein